MRKNRLALFGLMVVLSLVIAEPAHALVNWGENDLFRQLKDVFNKTDAENNGTGAQVGGLNASGTVKVQGKFITTTGNTQDLIYRSNLYANGRVGAASTVLFSSSTTFQQANLPYAYVYKAIGNHATTETSYLPRASWGQETTFFVYACGPAGSWTIRPDTAASSPVASTGWTTLKFAAAGQGATLLYLNDTLGYVIKSNWTSASVAAATITYPSLM